MSKSSTGKAVRTMLARLVPQNASCVAGLISSLTTHPYETRTRRDQVNPHTRNNDATCILIRLVKKTRR
jgi:hypothetical protein